MNALDHNHYPQPTPGRPEAGDGQPGDAGELTRCLALDPKPGR